LTLQWSYTKVFICKLVSYSSISDFFFFLLLPLLVLFFFCFCLVLCVVSPLTVFFHPLSSLCKPSCSSIIILCSLSCWALQRSDVYQNVLSRTTALFCPNIFHNLFRLIRCFAMYSWFMNRKNEIN